MKRIGSYLLTALVGLGLSNAAQADPKDIAVLQGLDKVTAKVTTFELGIDESFDFGVLRIRVRHCDRTPPEEEPESAAFLEIDELRPGQDQKVLFTGWMFASSPGLNAVEHAVYDVWVLECKDLPPTPEPDATQTE